MTTSNVVELAGQLAERARRATTKKWEHGYIRKDKKGGITFYIATKAKLPGAIKDRYDVSTGVGTKDEAFKAWERFLADPDGFTSKPEPKKPAEPPLILDAELAMRFLKWSKEEKGNSVQWVACQRQCLAWWSKQLGETNLRVSGGSDARRQWMKQHFLAAKNGTKGYSWAQKVAVLAVFFSWLRKVALELSPDTDPTYGQLDRPKPGKPSSTKQVITIQRFHEIREQLADGPYRWAFDVIMGTGRHAREVRRFAEAGTIVELEEGRPHATEGLPKAAAVLALPMTKAGVPAWVAVSAEVAESARKLRALGSIPAGRNGRGWRGWEEAIQDACEAADYKAGRIDPKAWQSYQSELAAVSNESKADVIRQAFRREHLQPQPGSGLFHAGWARRTVRTYAGAMGYEPFCDDFLGHARHMGSKHYGRHVPLKVATMI
jgi:hypothetical protein